MGTKAPGGLKGKQAHRELCSRCGHAKPFHYWGPCKSFSCTCSKFKAKKPKG